MISNYSILRELKNLKNGINTQIIEIEHKENNEGFLFSLSNSGEVLTVDYCRGEKIIKTDFFNFEEVFHIKEFLENIGINDIKNWELV